MADPGSMSDAENGQLRKLAPDKLDSRDWRTGYCRLKEVGDGISGEEERERDWCWQVWIFDSRNSLQNKMFSRAMVTNTAIPQLNCQPQAVKFCSTPLTGIQIWSAKNCTYWILTTSYFSSGTAFVLGSIPLSPPHNHFWEVTVDSPVYGTDVMVGVATNLAPLATGQRSYCSLLGREAESWGWSYQGYTQVANDSIKYILGGNSED